MSNVTVKPVETRREQKQFLQLAWSLYRGDKNWIPPLRRNLEELVGFRPHPFHEVADVRTWLAWRDGQVCGRIAGIVNHVHNEKYDEKTRLLWLLRIDRRSGGGPWPVRCRAAVVGGPGDPSVARARSIRRSTTRSDC